MSAAIRAQMSSRLLSPVGYDLTTAACDVGTGPTVTPRAAVASSAVMPKRMRWMPISCLLLEEIADDIDARRPCPRREGTQGVDPATPAASPAAVVRSVHGQAPLGTRAARLARELSRRAVPERAAPDRAGRLGGRGAHGRLAARVRARRLLRGPRGLGLRGGQRRRERGPPRVRRRGPRVRGRRDRARPRLILTRAPCVAPSG